MKHSNKYIIGLDEVGRGPLAGPVAVGGVFCIPSFKKSPFLSWYNQITDSKKLTSIKREYLAKELLSCSDIICVTSFVSAKYIDRYGIVAAIRKASLDVIDQIRNQVTSLLGTEWEKDGQILLDGKTDYGLRQKVSFPLQTIIKGDSLIREIGAASIVAKVERDNYMAALSNKKKYHCYDFHRHKGYGTLVHRNAIAQYGLSDIHRVSFCKNINVSNSGFHDHGFDQLLGDVHT